MTTREKIAAAKRELATATNNRIVAEQNMNLAARLESRAFLALELLVAKPERPERVVLSEEVMHRLKGNLTRSVGIKKTTR